MKQNLHNFKKIRVQFVHDVNHDSRHKARIVVDGRLAGVPLSRANSGLASLEGIRLVLFLAELNGLDS